MNGDKGSTCGNFPFLSLWLLEYLMILPDMAMNQRVDLKKYFCMTKDSPRVTMVLSDWFGTEITYYLHKSH